MPLEKRTKIVCTIGPASREVPVIASLIRAGMNAARLNFSHGTHKDHAELLGHVRQAAKETGEPVAVIADLQGPKIRLGALPESGVELKTGSTVVFTTKSGAFRNGAIPVTYKNLHKDVKVGHRILIEDGLYEVKVTAVKRKEIHTKVVNGGRVMSHKGMNFPDSTLRVSSITEKDKADAIFATKHGVEWLALSFVTGPDDVKRLRRIVAPHVKGGQMPPRMIVKIEKHEAIDRFEEILAVTDGVMVARGDLGVEIPAEVVPERQKAIIELCRLAGKPVIVATQMLDSMIRNPRPTRAEVSDVANAVFDHTDAMMLSGESATGKYPLQTVSMMARIAVEAEQSPYDDIPLVRERPQALEVSVAHALKTLAMEKHLDGILAFVAFAPWAERIHMSHPEVPLFLAVPDERLARQNNMRWGVKPFVFKQTQPKMALRHALAFLKKRGWVQSGMRLAVVLGAEHGRGFDLIEAE